MIPRWTMAAIVVATAWSFALAGDEERVTKARLAATPPMGWNSWEAFRKDLDEQALKAQVDAMVKLGLRDAGYVYVVIDGGWKTTQRDANGDLVPDPKKFPSGIKAFADYVHEHGMKFGLHQPAGVHDCGKDEPGSQGNEERDAAMFGAWGLDFVKYDQCDYIHDEKMTPGSPDLDKLVVRKGETVAFETEAEAAQNRLTGLVRIEDRDRSSGGKCVAGIGYGGGAVEIPDVRVAEAGKYGLQVQFCYPYYGQNRDRFKQMTFFVSVNGAARQRIDVPYAMAKRYTTDVVSLDVDLKEGENRIVFDNPSSQEEDVRLSYIKMVGALNRTGRQVIFSTSGAPRPWLWAQPIAHLWRTSGDIGNRWGSIMSTVDRQAETLRFAGPGFWADPDMLEVGAESHPPQGGKGAAGMSGIEQRSQFSLWAIMNAPLFISTDLRNVDDEALKILLNREVIAVNQDPMGVPGQRIREDQDVQVFAKRVIDGEVFALLNRGTEPAEIRVTAAELGLGKAALTVRDLWSGENRTVADGVVSQRVGRHEVALLRLRSPN